MGQDSLRAGSDAACRLSSPVYEALSAAMAGDDGVALEPIAETHRDRLRASCAQDQDIWEIYPHSMIGKHFDPAFAAIGKGTNRIGFAAVRDEQVVGTTSYLAVDAANHVLEIGGTYFEPRVRGTAFNMTIKHMMIGRAIECGFTRIELRADARNTRSCAAIAKLGAVYEGTLRANRITWTGHVRDTVVFSILASEWLNTHSTGC